MTILFPTESDRGQKGQMSRYRIPEVQLAAIKMCVAGGIIHAHKYFPFLLLCFFCIGSLERESDQLVLIFNAVGNYYRGGKWGCLMDQPNFFLGVKKED